VRGAIQLKPSSKDKSRQREGVKGSGGVTEKTGEGAVFKDVEEMEAPEDEKPTEVQKQKNDEKEKKEKRGIKRRSWMGSARILKVRARQEARGRWLQLK
jgi:hypothetical protein